ncbi:MAG: hypothetical protein PHO01_07435 [Desulfotomaculaceae bacterium]|nr:hypothetical protein [Desulfotomaculaceae bacterium]
MKNLNDYLSISTIVLLCICSICGIFSMDFSNSFDVVNQYGDTVTIFGSGIYAGDTYFKAPILIGTDMVILFVVVPLFTLSYLKNRQEGSNADKLRLLSYYAVAFYYAVSIAFGVKYNQLHLIYIGLFGCTLFGLFYTARGMNITHTSWLLTNGLKRFLAITGMALIIAWLPDIVPTILSGRPIPLIGVYTTEITYVLDMGVVAPLCFICLNLLKKGDNVGVIILAAILKSCIIIGIMVVSQSVCQYLSGAELPLPVLITKAASFVILGAFAFHFERKLYARL